MSFSDSVPTRMETPTGPDLEPVQLMHRGHDGYVAFASKGNPAGEFRQLYSVRARDLDGVFPQLMPQLDADSFYSINGFFRAGYGNSQHSPDGLRLPRAHRNSDDVRWLTCTFADLDCHNIGLTLGQTLGLVMDAQNAGIIPPLEHAANVRPGILVFLVSAGSTRQRTAERLAGGRPGPGMA